MIVEADDLVDSDHGEATIESEGHKTSEEDDNDDSICALKQALEEISQQKQALEDEVAAIKQDLTSSRARITELCKMNCIHVHEYDKIVAAKDNEIKEL